jgi:hypothetical protein
MDAREWNRLHRLRKKPLFSIHRAFRVTIFALRDSGAARFDRRNAGISIDFSRSSRALLVALGFRDQFRH